jgi:hypothetical protein
MKIATLVLGIVVLTLPLAADEKKGAKINVEPTSFDFGQVVAGATVEKEFVIRNFGVDPLEISEIVPSCGCTVVDKSYPKSIKTGASGAFRLSLRVPAAPGHLVKSVLIRSNDPQKPLFEVKLEATVAGQSH